MTNRLLLVIATVLLATGVGTRAAEADRKRIVILPFEGDKAEKFHASMVKLVKKSHSVVSTAKWETTAEGLGAEKINEKNIKKVAKKMKVDGVIEGTITKRRDEYVVKLKLRAGKDGAVVANASVKAEGTKLDGSTGKEIKDELVSAIDNLESADGGDDEKPAKKANKKDDDDEKPAKKGKKDDDDEKPAKKGKKDDDEKPAKKAKKDDDEKPAKKGKKDDDEKPDDAKKSKFGGNGMKEGKDAKAAKKDDDEKPAKKDDDEKPSKKGGDDDDEKPAKKKKVAKGGDGDGDGEIGKKADEPGVKMESALALSPGNRAIDVVVGVSLNARRLSWQADGDLPSSSIAGAGMGKPPNYKGVPAPGAILDLTAYPLAFGHTNKSITKDIGIQAMYDKALLISSEAGGMKLTTTAQRILVGPVFRYALGKGAGAPVIGGSLKYGKQSFTIAGADLPNVNYSMIEPGVFFKYGIGKIQANIALNYMLVTNSGDMQSTTQYGKSSKSGFDIEAGADYSLTKSLFARGAVKFESITHKFDGSGMLSTGRDGDPEQDVKGAKDTYIGAIVTIGYLY